ncbi:acyltransferase family protein [Segatella copri]|uniref:acyltransferase family protein n=1 Tax=Segatella TaxID=2974251 RepID=UPI0034616DDF
MTKKGIEWLDFARVFVMFLVIVDHLGLENRFIRDFIWSFHMPVFFFISGIFHSNKLPWGSSSRKISLGSCCPSSYGISSLCVLGIPFFIM